MTRLNVRNMAVNARTIPTRAVRVSWKELRHPVKKPVKALNQSKVRVPACLPHFRHDLSHLLTLCGDSPRCDGWDLFTIYGNHCYFTREDPAFRPEIPLHKLKNHRHSINNYYVYPRVVTWNRHVRTSLHFGLSGFDLALTFPAPPRTTHGRRLFDIIYLFIFCLFYARREINRHSCYLIFRLRNSWFFRVKKKKERWINRKTDEVP